MRITVHLDMFAHSAPATYAILWLDRDAGKWSREGHAGLALPAWGPLALTPGRTAIGTPGGSAPCCVLEGLDLTATDGPYEGETGVALWLRDSLAAPVHGQWHVQWVDTDEATPEHSVFADEET
jgi:hypothetical protein